MHDLKFALPGCSGSRPATRLRRSMILSLGIGANTTIFSIVNAIELRPLPFAESTRIMRLWRTPPPTFAAAPNGRHTSKRGLAEDEGRHSLRGTRQFERITN